MHRFATTALALVFLSSTAAAQWTRVDSNSGIPDGLTPAALTWNGSALYSLHLQTGPSALRMFTSSNDGGSWTDVPAFPGSSVGFNYFGSLDGRLAIAGITNDASSAYFRMSDDGGTTWSEFLADDIGNPAWLARRGSTMFAATNLGVAASTDGGATWQLTGDDLPTAAFVVTTPNALIAQSSLGTYRSDDDGVTWTQIMIPASFNFFHRPWVHDGVIYMKNQISANIHVSSDEGATWTTYESFSLLDFTTVLVQPGTGAWFPYAVASGGANFYTTTDLAVSAEPIDLTGYPLLTAGQPCFASPIITDSAIYVTANLCFNDNNGIYRYDLSPDTAVDRLDVPSSVLVDAPYPNPTTSLVTVPVTLSESGSVEIRVSDTLGRVVGSTSPTTLSPGAHELTAELNGLSPGVYGVTIHAGRTTETRQIIVVH